MDGTNATVDFKLSYTDSADPLELDGGFYVTVFDLDTQWQPDTQTERLCIDDDQYHMYITDENADFVTTKSNESCTGTRPSSARRTWSTSPARTAASAESRSGNTGAFSPSTSGSGSSCSSSTSTRRTSTS